MDYTLLTDFAVFLFLISFFFGASNILTHISCFIARITKKKVCHCWDCPKKCELYEHSEPEVGLDLDDKLYFFCGYCNHNICSTSEGNNNIKRFHTYCGHCGNKINWSQLQEREWYMEKDIKPFGTGKTIGLLSKIIRK